jgi:hypothetical protein
MNSERLELYRQLEQARDSKIILYVTGDRRGLETQIHPEAIEMLESHLDRIGCVERITLVLYTRGGQTLAAWSIVNLIRQYCTDFEVIVPSKAHSAGTLICLGANRIVMTQHATLGPIDPSVNTPLNPSVPGGPPTARYPVNVEAISGYLELAKEIGIRDGHDLVAVLTQLTQHVHPLVLGQVFRTRSQIRMLGARLLNQHMSDGPRIERILAFLCSESGSHDYTIYRQEASTALSLPVEFPSEVQYNLITRLQSNLASELQLNEPYDPRILFAQRGRESTVEYQLTRALVESVEGGSHRFVSRGQLSLTLAENANVGAETVIDSRLFEGWEHESAD